MKVAIYGKNLSENHYSLIYKVFEILNREKAEIYVYKIFWEYLNTKLFLIPKIKDCFKTEDIKEGVFDVVISIGGDGTFLEAVALLKKHTIPIVGINSGRLGFLATVSEDNIETSLKDILSNKFTIEKRTLLSFKVRSEKKFFQNFPYALNELTLLKKDTASMITIDVCIDGQYLNSYWSDGLIISTPTGSTAYSLSAGGPLILPGSQNIVITPLAPHTLTVRPIVVPDTVNLKIKVSGRGQKFLAALDSRNAFIDYGVEIYIKKADFYLNMVKLENYDYFATLRKKLMWGLDIRN